MNVLSSFAAAALGLAIAAAPLAAQTTDARSAARAEAAQRESRYQINQMERVLEGAVEHGVTVTRDRLQALAQSPVDLLFSDNAHARGFRLEGYGVFFDVIVPSFEAQALAWSMRTLDQNDLGLDSALRTLRGAVRDSNDANVEQALKRIELQVGPTARTVQDTAGARDATGSAQSIEKLGSDPIVQDPNQAFRAAVVEALKDAMLEHSSSLGIAPGESLTIAAKGNDDRPRLAPADTTGRTAILRLQGADLAAFLARQITKADALARIEVRVF